MAVNTNKIGYSVSDVCQIVGCTPQTVHNMIDRKEIECLIDEPKTVGGRRKFRFLKEHIQHYMLKHFEKFDDVTLRTWGVITTPKKIVQNASTPRIPLETLTKPVHIEGTDDRNMAPAKAADWSAPSKPAAKPYLRTPEVKAQERAAKPEPKAYTDSTTIGRDPKTLKENPKFQKTFPKFKIEVDANVNGMILPNDVVIHGIESFTAGEIAKALLTDRNFRCQEIRIVFDGMVNKEN